MTADFTGIVLAGGRSSRFGSNKALAPWRGTTMAAAVTSTLRGLFPLVLVVTRNRAGLSGLAGPGVRLVDDAFPLEHPLGGLHTGLKASPTDLAFACACDMPLVRPALVSLLCARAAGYEAVVPVWEGRPQPLCAVYSRSCLGPIEAMVAAGNLRITALAGAVRSLTVTAEEVRSADPSGDTFVDVDFPADLGRAERRAG